MAENYWDKLLADEMAWAIAQRTEVKRDEEFMMRVSIVGPGRQLFRTPLVWKSEEQKRLAMKLVSHVCGQLSALAVVVATDARMLNVPGFCRRFNIAEPIPPDYEAFNRERRRIMENFGNYMGNLPADCYEDALIVWIKGPAVCIVSQVKYQANGETIVFEPENRGSEKSQVLMLPEWWKE